MIGLSEGRRRLEIDQQVWRNIIEPWWSTATLSAQSQYGGRTKASQAIAARSTATRTIVTVARSGVDDSELAMPLKSGNADESRLR